MINAIHLIYAYIANYRKFAKIYFLYFDKINKIPLINEEREKKKFFFFYITIKNDITSPVYLRPEKCKFP